MKDAIIRFIESCTRDKDFRMGLIIAPSIIIGILVLLIFAKGCFEYDTCVEPCSRYSGEINEATIKCLEHCDER